LVVFDIRKLNLQTLAANFELQGTEQARSQFYQLGDYLPFALKSSFGLTCFTN